MAGLNYRAKVDVFREVVNTFRVTFAVLFSVMLQVGVQNVAALCHISDKVYFCQNLWSLWSMVHGPVILRSQSAIGLGVGPKKLNLFSKLTKRPYISLFLKHIYRDLEWGFDDDR